MKEDIPKTFWARILIVNLCNDSEEINRIIGSKEYQIIEWFFGIHEDGPKERDGICFETNIGKNKAGVFV